MYSSSSQIWYTLFTFPLDTACECVNAKFFFSFSWSFLPSPPQHNEPNSTISYENYTKTLQRYCTGLFLFRQQTPPPLKEWANNNGRQNEIAKIWNQEHPTEEKKNTSQENSYRTRNVWRFSF